MVRDFPGFSQFREPETPEPLKPLKLLYRRTRVRTVYDATVLLRDLDTAMTSCPVFCAHANCYRTVHQWLTTHVRDAHMRFCVFYGGSLLTCCSIDMHNQHFHHIEMT